MKDCEDGKFRGKQSSSAARFTDLLLTGMCQHSGKMPPTRKRAPSKSTHPFGFGCSLPAPQVDDSDLPDAHAVAVLLRTARLMPTQLRARRSWHHLAASIWFVALRLSFANWVGHQHCLLLRDTAWLFETL